jgi:hypothetical protein
VPTVIINKAGGPPLYTKPSWNTLTAQTSPDLDTLEDALFEDKNTLLGPV